MNKNLQVAIFSRFITGKHGCYKWGKTEKFEIPEKFVNIGPEYTKRCGIATIGGYVF